MIFLHRRQSILPFTQELPEDSVLDILRLALGRGPPGTEATGTGAISGKADRVQAAGTLLAGAFKPSSSACK